MKIDVERWAKLSGNLIVEAVSRDVEDYTKRFPYSAGHSPLTGAEKEEFGVTDRDDDDTREAEQLGLDRKVLMDMGYSKEDIMQLGPRAGNFLTYLRNTAAAKSKVTNPVEELEIGTEPPASLFGKMFRSKLAKLEAAFIPVELLESIMGQATLLEGNLDEYELEVTVEDINEEMLGVPVNFEPFDPRDIVTQDNPAAAWKKLVANFVKVVLRSDSPPDEKIESYANAAANEFFRQNPQWLMLSGPLGLTRQTAHDMIKKIIIAALKTGKLPSALQEAAKKKGKKHPPLGKVMRGDVKKFKVYVKDKRTGNVKKVNFGDPNMEIRRDNPKARKSFRARHGCGTPRASDRTKAAYWSCRMWSRKPVSKILKGK